MPPKLNNSTVALKYHVTLFQLIANYSQKEECNIQFHSPLKYSQQLYSHSRREEEQQITFKNVFLGLNQGIAHFHFPFP